MGVYVDRLRDYGWRHGPSCHLIADSIEELIEFAAGIGLKLEWFQPKSSPHFDLTADARELAIDRGAIELTQREVVIKLRELRSFRPAAAGKFEMAAIERRRHLFLQLDSEK